MIFLCRTRRLMSILLESLILPQCFWSLMGLSCYFTWMTFEFWKRSCFIWRVMASRYEWSGLWWTHCHLWVVSTHPLRFHFNPLITICIFLLFNFISNLSLILEILFNYATFLVRVPDASFLGIKKFIDSSPSDEFLNNSINV